MTVSRTQPQLAIPLPTDRRRRPAWAASLLVAASAIALVACSSTPAASTAPSVAVPSASASTSAEPSVEPSTAPSASAAAVQDLAITGKEFAFEAPASIPAGPTKVTLTNAGKEEHQAQIAKIADGKTFADLIAALQGPDESAALALVSLNGGPTGVIPGASGSTTVDLTPGQYAFLCFVASSDGVPHLAKGMVAPMEVTAPASTAEVPTGDTAITLQDFAFVGLDTLSTGAHTVTVTNDGPQPHEATIVKLSDGVTAQQLLTAFVSGEAPAGPPPFTSAGGIAGIAAGSTATVDVDLPAGEYAFVCFVPDPATGKAHAELGMVGALTVQ
ncbi:MAG: hypothetical protein ACTS8Z_07755 [Candidatus Limnocylindrales bacterium]